MADAAIRLGVTVLGVAAIGLWVGAFVHAAIQPDGAWAAVGRRRSSWIVCLALFGWVAGIVYLLAVRPGLRAAVVATTRQGPGSGGQP